MIQYDSEPGTVNPATFIHYALEGAVRVAKVIDTSSDYDAIIGRSINDELRSRLSVSRSLSEPRQAAIAYTIDTIMAARQATFRLPDVDLLFMGRTQNNIREFQFFRSLLRWPPDPAHANVVDLPLRNTDLDPGITGLLPDIVAQIYEKRSSFSPALVHQVTRFLTHYTRYVLSMAHSRSTLPGIAVVANDHSPNTVAFALAAKCFGVPRVYLQHAEVSGGFPALDFEISILRNNRSKQIYAELGPSSGDVFVISRFAEPFVHPSLGFDENGRIPVVIYTTGRVRLEGLVALLEQLHGNPKVSAVYIKPHPNQEPIDWPAGANIHPDPFTEKHLAIAGNSSVVVELLHRGIPVWQNFDFDPVERDYYGFVRSKVVAEVQLSALSSPFWQGAEFGPSWYEEFSHSFSPSQEDNAAEIERFQAAIRTIGQERFRPRLKPAPAPVVKTPRSEKPKRQVVHRPSVKLGKLGRRLLDTANKLVPDTMLEAVKYVAYESRLRNRPAIKELRASDLVVTKPTKPIAPPTISARVKRDWLKYSLTSAGSPGQWLNVSLSAGIVSNEEAIKALTQLEKDHAPELHTLFDEAERLGDHVPVLIWVLLKRLDVSDIGLPYSLIGLIKTISEISDTRYVKASLEDLAFSACRKLGRTDALDLLAKKSRNIRRKAASLPGQPSGQGDDAGS